VAPAGTSSASRSQKAGDMAKVAKVRISKDFFEMFLRADYGTQPNTTIESNAPKDLKVLGLRTIYDFYPYTFWVYVESEEFENIPEGAEPPEIEPFVYTVRHGE
jgi:hypothetical protein